MLRLFLISLFCFSACQAEELHWELSDTPTFDYIHPAHAGYCSEEAGFSLPDEAAEWLDPAGSYYVRFGNEAQDGPSPVCMIMQNTTPASAIWPKREAIDQQTWDSAEPFLLPYSHPLRAKLDAIFQRSHAAASREALKQAGFKLTLEKREIDVTVASHPSLKGYLLKIYTDQQNVPDYFRRLRKRIIGAQLIQETIERQGFQQFAKVPKKWLYPLPDQPAPADSKKFLLVAEYMPIFHRGISVRLWKHQMTKPKLAAIYYLLNELGLFDSIYILNMPFALDNRIAFIDTEYFNHWPVNLEFVGGYLNKEMKAYWQHLMNTQGIKQSR